jgi:hypothetical protein
MENVLLRLKERIDFVFVFEKASKCPLLGDYAGASNLLIFLNETYTAE